MNNFHHIPSSCIINGTCGKWSSAHAQSMRVHAMPQSQRCRSTLDLDSRQNDRSICFSHRTNSTVQHSTVRYVARVCVLHA